MVAMTMLCGAVLLTTGPITLASPGLKGVGVEPDRATFYSDHVAQQLAMGGVRVTTSSQLQAMLGLERQRQLLACANDDSSCIAELANGLGVETLLVGSIARIGDGFQANVSIITSSDGRTLSLRSLRAASEAELLDALTRAAQEMGGELRGALRPGEAGPGKKTSPLLWATVPAVLGLAGAGAGIGCALSAQSHVERLRGAGTGASMLSYTDAVSTRSEGQLLEGLAIASFALAGIALAVTAWLLLRSWE